MNIIDKRGIVHENNYTPRAKREIYGFTMHWIAGTADSAMNVVQDPNHEACYHYTIDTEGNVYHILDNTNIAYHAGNWDYNVRTIGIGHAGGWPIDDAGNLKDPTQATEDASAELLAKLSKEYGLGKLELDKNVWLHEDVRNRPTACPGTLDVQEIINKANKIMSGKSHFQKEYEQIKAVFNERAEDLNGTGVQGDDGNNLGYFRGVMNRGQLSSAIDMIFGSLKAENQKAKRLAGEKSDLRNKLNAAQASIQKLQEENNELTQYKKAMDQDNQGLRDDLVACRSEKDKLENQIQKLKENKSSLQSQINQLQQELDNEKETFKLNKWTIGVSRWWNEQGGSELILGGLLSIILGVLPTFIDNIDDNIIYTAILPQINTLIATWRKNNLEGKNAKKVKKIEKIISNENDRQNSK